MTETRAQVYLYFTGNTLFTLGTATSATGVLYMVNKVSGWGIKALESLPYWLNVGQIVTQKEEDEQILKREDVIKEGKSLLKISGVVTIGAFVTFLGKGMLNPNTAKALNEILYKSATTQ